MAVFVVYIFYINLIDRYGGVESIRIHPRLMWTPDLLLYNRFCFCNTLDNILDILNIFKNFFKSKDVLLIALLHKSLLFSFIPQGMQFEQNTIENRKNFFLQYPHSHSWLECTTSSAIEPFMWKSCAALNAK